MMRSRTGMALLSLACAALFGAARGPTTRTSEDGRLCLTLPDGWADYNSPDHSIAARDTRARMFLTAHSHARQDFDDITLDEYALMGVEHAKQFLEDIHEGEYVPEPLGEHATLRVELRCVQQRMKWIYTLVFVETERNFHTLTLVTRPSSHKDGLAALEGILSSLTELDPAATAPDPPATAPGR